MSTKRERERADARQSQRGTERKLQDGMDASHAPEEGDGAEKSSSVRLAEEHKTDESGAVID